MVKMYSPQPSVVAYRRDWVRYVILGFILLTILFLAGITRKYIHNQSYYLQETVLRQVENTFTVHIKYDSISPTFWGWFHINGVEVYGIDLDVQAQRLTIHFDIWKVLLGQRDISLVTKIDFNRVHADIKSDKQVFNQLENPSDDRTFMSIEENIKLLSTAIFDFLRNGLIDTPQLNLSLSLRNVSFSYKALWGNLGVENFLFTVEPLENSYHIEISAEPLLSLASGIHMNIPLRVSGQVNKDLLSGDLRFNITNLYRHIISVEEQGLRVQWRDGVLEVRKNIDVLPVDYGVRIDSIERSVHLGFNTYQFRPRDIFQNPSMGITQSLVSYIDGFGSLLYYPDLDIFYYGMTSRLDLNFKQHDWRIKADVIGTNQIANIRELSLLYNNDSYLNFVGNIDWSTGIPDGTLDYLGQNLENKWSGRIIFNNRQHFMQVYSDVLYYNNYSLGRLDGIIYPKEDTYNIFLQFDDASGKSEESNKLSLIGFFDKNKKELEISLSGGSLDLTVFSLSGLIPKYFRDWKAHMQAKFTWNPSQFIFLVRDMEIKQDAEHRINFSARWTNKDFEIHNIGVFWGNYFAKLRLSGQIEEEIAFLGEVTSTLTEYGFYGSWNRDKLLIANSYGYIEWTFSEATILSVIEEMPLRFSYDAPRLNANIEVSLKPYWQILIRGLSVEGDDIYLDIPRSQISEQGGTINQIKYKDVWSDLYGSIKYERLSDNHHISVVMSSNDLLVNRELHTLEMSYDGDFKGSIRLVRFPLDRLRLPELEGIINTEIKVNGLIKQKSIDVFVDVPRGFYKDRVIRLGLMGEYSDFGLSFSQLFVQYGEHLLQGGVLLSNFSEKSFIFSGQYGQVNRNYQLGFVLDFASETANENLFLSSVLYQPWRMLVTFDPLTVNNRVMLAGSRMLLQHKNNEYSLEGLNTLRLKSTYNADTKRGDFVWYGQQGLTVDSIFSLDEDSFFINISHLVVPLMMFNPYFTKAEGERIIGFEAGRLEGFVHIDADWVLTNGDLRFTEDASLRLLHVPKDVLNVGGAIVRITDNELILMSDIKNQLVNYVEIPVGSSRRGVTLDLKARAIIGEPFFNYDVSLNIRANNSSYNTRNGLNYDISLGNLVRMQGQVNGSIIFEGDTTGARLSGDLYVVNLEGNLGALTVFMNDKRVKKHKIPTTKNPKLGFLVQAASSEDARYEPLKLRTGNQVSFYVPPTIEISAMKDQELILVIDVQRGAPVGQNYVYLEGDLYIKRGEIRVTNTNFKIKEGGLIRFNEAYGFNPLLVFSADFKTYNGHTITMNFEDQSLNSNYGFTFTSYTLNQREIMQYLGLGLISNATTMRPGESFSDEEQNFYESQKDIKSNDYPLKAVIDPIGGIAEQYLARQLEKLLKFIPFVDTVTVRTNVVSNLAVSRFSSSGSALVSENNEFNDSRTPWEIFDQTSISAGFRITPLFTLEGTFGMSKLVGERRYFGDAGQLLPNIGINLNFDTPVFLVSWSFAPTLARRSIDQLFVGSVSLGFTRSFYFRDWKDFVDQLGEKRN